MTEFIPYLAFNGNCEEAVNFYRDCLNGEITGMQRFGETPMEVEEEFKNRIVHASLKFDDCTLMASDTTNQTINPGDNISLSISTGNLEKGKNYFNKLAQGGKITMPMQETFWGATFGMLTDKFGMHWMVNCEKEK